MRKLLSELEWLDAFTNEYTFCVNYEEADGSWHHVRIKSDNYSLEDLPHGAVVYKRNFYPKLEDQAVFHGT